MPRGTLPLAPLERIVKGAGVERVSREALLALQEALEDHARELAEEALRYARHARRRTVTQEDVKLAAGR